MNDLQKLILYHDDQLDAEEIAEIKQALAQQPQLQQEWAELQALRGAFQQLAQEEEQAYQAVDLTESIMCEVEQNAHQVGRQTRAIDHTSEIKVSTSSSWWSSNWQALLLGAAVAAAVLLTWQWVIPSLNHNATRPKNSTVLINLHESNEAESAPVIWLLDEEDTEEEAGNPDQDATDEPPPI